MASFMKYPRRSRLKTDTHALTMRHMLHVGISGGKCNAVFLFTNCLSQPINTAVGVQKNDMLQSILIHVATVEQTLRSWSYA